MSSGSSPSIRQEEDLNSFMEVGRICQNADWQLKTIKAGSCRFKVETERSLI